MEFRNLNPGDVVTASATVLTKLDRDGEYHVQFSNGQRIWLPHTAITAVTAKPLAVDDRVNVVGSTSTPGTIQAVVGGRAWVKWDNGNEAVYRLDSLYRQPA